MSGIEDKTQDANRRMPPLRAARSNCCAAWATR